MTTMAPEFAPETVPAPEPVVALPRRTIDRLLVGLGIIFAVVLFVAGGLLLWGSNFASDYVEDELSSQMIFFPAEESLVAQEREDLVQYAEEQVTTGKEAEAYASFIDGHLQGVADGQTYAQLSEPQTAAREALAAAQESGASDEEIATLEEEFNTITTQRDTLFKGETLRGLLLSTYAWSTIGNIAGVAAIVAFVAGAAMVVLVILGFVHIHKSKATT
jgi:hypothetical protein